MHDIKSIFQILMGRANVNKNIIFSWLNFAGLLLWLVFFRFNGMPFERGYFGLNFYFNTIIIILLWVPQQRFKNYKLVQSKLSIFHVDGRVSTFPMFFFFLLPIPTNQLKCGGWPYKIPYLHYMWWGCQWTRFWLG